MEQKITILYGIPAQGAAGASKVAIDAEVAGEHFAVHRPVRRTPNGFVLESAKWNITHVPSGAYVASNVVSKELASAIVGKLAMQPLRWHQVNPFERMNGDSVETIKEIIHALAKSKTVDEAWEHGRRLKTLLDRLQIH